MSKDFFGKVIKIGDWVAYSSSDGAELKVGRIASFTLLKVGLINVKTGNYNIRSSEQVSLISKEV